MVFLCVCVLAQILGTPITSASLVAADMSVESVSTEFAIPAVMLERRSISRFLCREKITPSRCYAIFGTVFFRPPKA